MAQNTYRENARNARAQADAATLDNVRDRCLRAEAAWLAMAERQERVDKGRAGGRSGGSSAAPGMEDLVQIGSGDIAR